MANQVTGIVQVSVNGALQRSEVGATLDFGGKERSPAVGYRVYGFYENLKPSTLHFTLFHMSSTDLVALKDLVGATASFICDSGPVFTITNAFVAKCITLKGGDGKVEVEMVGDPIDSVH